MQFNLNKFLIAGVLGAGPNKAAARLRSKAGKRDIDGPGIAAVANRNGGSVSFIPENPSNVTTVSLPVNSEPMYVNSNNEKIYVGDRGRNVIMVFDPKDIFNPRDINIDNAECFGIFHQWLNDKFLVAACTGTKSIALLRLSDSTLSYIDLDSLGDGLGGCIPHDIVINEKDEIFVTTLASSGSCTNQIIKIKAETGMEIARVDAGVDVDPHVALKPGDNILYSPQQKKNGGTVVLYRQRDLEEVQSLDVPNAHGICFSPDGDDLFVTDLNGARMLLEIEPAQRNKDAELTGAEGSIVESGVAHNCAVTQSKKIFVTHSGPSAVAVSLFEKVGGKEVVYLGAIESGANPFGLAIYNGKTITGLP